MKNHIYLIAIICGLSGCISHKKEMEYKYRFTTDSIFHVRSDNSLQINQRWTRGLGTETIRELTFSIPNDSGKQYLEKVIYSKRKWCMEDSIRTNIEKTVTDSIAIKQQNTTGTYKEKEQKKQQGNNRWKWLTTVLILFSLYTYLYRRN